jgi:hypothetical protein
MKAMRKLPIRKEESKENDEPELAAAESED